MEQQEQLLLEPLLNENMIRRRELLPTWMKIFVWIFMITGAIASFCFLAGLSGTKLKLALYGIESQEPLSFAGLFVLLLFLFKGIVAFGLWTEKDWAIKLGIADAILGIIVCIYVMAINPFLNNNAGFVMNLRLELVALIPYLMKLKKIKPLWELR